MTIKRVRNADFVVLAENKPATTAFSSDIGAFQEMTVGFIQVCHTVLTDFKGCFTLFVSNKCEPSTLVELPGSEKCFTAACPNSLGWHLTKIGYLFFQVRYVPNGQVSGTITQVNAVGKKG